MEYNKRKQTFENYLSEMKQYCTENEIIETQRNIVCLNFKNVFTTFTKEVLKKRVKF